MAAASLGRLTLDLAVKLSSYEQGMTQAERKTKETTEKMGKAFGGFKSQVADALGGTQIGSIVDSFNAKIGSLKGGAMVAGAAFAGMAVGGIAVAFGALSKLAIETAKADAQLLVLANRANTSAENFQVLQYAASGLGVTQDQLGSILADVQEKLGEFSATQGGGAADFFDALRNNTKMTDDQIKKFGATLQGKDGVEAIQLLSDKLDELGVTTQERRFVFESLASDLGNLAPLFAENGDLLKQYGDVLKEAGVIKTAEALEQSKLLAAQTESVRMRFEGFKSQLAGQMMPVLNSLVSYFMEGATKGGNFGSVINSVGVIAKGVAVVIVGLAAAIQSVIRMVSAFAEQAANISITASNVLNADGVVAKARALKQGFLGATGIAVDAYADISKGFTDAVGGIMSTVDSTLPKLDSLSQANLALAEAANKSASGLKLDTKTAEENAKAKEKAAKESEKLNKQLQVNARVQANAAKYNFSSIEGQYKLPKGLLSAINMQESRGNANAIGPMTKYGQAKGGFQFLDGTAKRFGLIGSEVFNTGKAAEAAAKYFQFLFQKFGTWEKAISAYHAGEGNVERGTGLGPINRQYVKNVLEYMDSALKGVGTTAADAVKYVEETYKAQRSIVAKYLTEQEKLEYENAVSIQEIKDAFVEDDLSREKYLKLQQLIYQKDVEAFKKAQDEKRQAAFEAINNPIGEMIGFGVNAKAKATLNQDQYARWEMGKEQQDGYSQLADNLYSVREGIQNNEYLTDTEKYAQLNEAYRTYLESKKALTQEYAQQEADFAQYQHENQLSLYGSLLSQAGGVWGEMTQMVRDAKGENSKTFKAMFLAQQSMAIAQQIINTELAAGATTAQTGIFGLPAAAVIRGIGYASVGLIAAQTVQGMAHDGIDNIPKEGTWLLDKGERVVDSRTNADLKDYLAKGGGSGGDVNITVHVTDSGVSTQSNQNEQKQLGQMIGNAVRTIIRQEQRQGGLLSK